MEPVVLIVHLVLALAIILLVLLQRSEGGGLGIGGSGGGLGQFAGARATANVLTRATAICAAGFFCTSLILGILANVQSRQRGILETYGNVTPPALSEDISPSEAQSTPGSESGSVDSSGMDSGVPVPSPRTSPPSVPISE